MVLNDGQGNLTVSQMLSAGLAELAAHVVEIPNNQMQCLQQDVFEENLSELAAYL